MCNRGQAIEAARPRVTLGGQNMWNKDERDGKIDQAKGKVKQAVGDLTNDPDLKAEGQVDEAAGKGQAAVGQVRRKVGDAIASVANAVKH
jgi:uncharacterized protein YjbJ (UPF0337 family)